MTDTTNVPVALDQLEVDRVDAVAGPANGIPFLIVKALDAQPSRAQAIAVLRDSAPHRTRTSDPYPGALSHRTASRG